jgi:hypothetical protein
MKRPPAKPDPTKPRKAWSIPIYRPSESGTYSEDATDSGRAVPTMAASIKKTLSALRW